jgi:hypothetical protein
MVINRRTWTSADSCRLQVGNSFAMHKFKFSINAMHASPWYGRKNVEFGTS